MAVNLSAPQADDLKPVDGLRLASVYAGIRKARRDDLVLLALDPGATTAAVFTRNAFCAAPVQVARQHLGESAPRYLLINAGNANAGTGDKGLQAARASCRMVAEQGGCESTEVLPFSTGVIGEYLPVERIGNAMTELFGQLSSDNWLAAAEAITTTDTVAKAVSRQCRLADGRVITVTGMAKGAGMICPDMATLLAYVATDAPVGQTLLSELLKTVVADSFNSITVDGDTSTNDACVLMATGAAGGSEIEAGSDDEFYLLGCLKDVFKFLAQACIRDAEGATKLITLNVSAAASREEARTLAYTIAHSPLVKTALFASDPNWGRILAAVGRAGIDQLDLSRVSIHLNGVCIVEGGERDAAYTEEAGAAAMAASEIEIAIGLGRGDATAQVWTCDLGYEYVRINAEYRT
ncbi:MAG: bifunctional glutamate N-acetyltransferase/amino-acid acetyltransferase ArgJ [Pseudomonadota bacterium]